MARELIGAGEQTRTRRNVVVVIVVTCMVFMGALAHAAQAASAAGAPQPVAATGSAGSDAGSLSAVFDSPNAGSALAAVGCPIAHALPSPPVPNEVSSVVCALGVLNYAYRTMYVGPSGVAVTRIMRATVGVPTALDVDGNGSVDFVGTLLPGPGLGLTLDVLRNGNFSATAHVSIEAIALNPAAPESYLGAGEDGLAAGTDREWKTTVTLVSDTSAGTELAVTQKNNGAPSTVGTIGELFSGPDPDDPTDVSRGDVSFTPVPASLTTDISLGQDKQKAHITTSASSLVSAAITLSSPDDTKELHATVCRLAKWVDVTYTHPSDATDVSYSASATVAHITAVYRDTSDGSLATAAALDMKGVPSGVTVDQHGAQTTVTTTGGTIGSIEARYGSGRDVPDAATGTDAYASYHGYSDGSLTAAVRLPKLQHLTLDSSAQFSGDLTLGSALSYVDLSAQDDNAGIALTGHMSNLPQHTTVGINITSATNGDNGGGTVAFNGHGLGLDEIVVHVIDTKHATDPSHFLFAHATRLDATIDGIPASDTISFGYSTPAAAPRSTDPVTTKMFAVATAPIGSITALASDGSDAPAVTGSGVWYIDTKDEYNVFARIDHLTHYALALTTITTFDSATAHSTDTIQSVRGSIGIAQPDRQCGDNGGQDATLHAQTDAGTFDGTIDALPSSVSFSYGPDTAGNEVIDYVASGPISKITADASGFQMPLPQATKFHGEIDCLPAQLTLTLPMGGGVSLDTHGAYIGHVLAQVFGSPGPAAPTPNRQTVLFNSEKSQITLDVGNVGPLEITQGSGPLTIKYDISSATELKVSYIRTGSVAPLDVGFSLSDPEPAELIVAPGDSSLHIAYHVNTLSRNLSNHGVVDSLGFETNAGTTDWLQGTLENIPVNLDLCALYATGTACVPDWVKQDAADSLKDVPSARFALDVIPTDSHGNLPTTPLTLTQTRFCVRADASTCDALGQSTTPVDGVVVDTVSFRELQFAFGQRSADCGDASFSCGRAFMSFNSAEQPTTGPLPFSGDYTYYSQGHALVSFDAPTGTDPSNPSAYVEGDHLFKFVAYNAAVDDWPTDTYTAPSSDGQQSLICSGNPHLTLIVPLPDDNSVSLDLLSGRFGACG